MVVSTTDETPSARGVTGVEAELPHGRLSASPGEAKTSEKTFFLCVNWPFNASRSRTMQTRGATFTFICPVKDCNKRMEQPLKTGLKNTRDLWEIKLWPLGAAVAVVNIIWQWFFFFPSTRCDWYPALLTVLLPTYTAEFNFSQYFRFTPLIKPGRILLASTPYSGGGCQLRRHSHKLWGGLKIRPY